MQNIWWSLWPDSSYIGQSISKPDLITTLFYLAFERLNASANFIQILWCLRQRQDLKDRLKDDAASSLLVCNAEKRGVFKPSTSFCFNILINIKTEFHVHFKRFQQITNCGDEKAIYKMQMTQKLYNVSTMLLHTNNRKTNKLNKCMYQCIS